MIRVERAQIEDAAAILAVQVLAYQQEAQLYQEPNLPPLRETLAELEAEFATHVILKAVNSSLTGGVIVGSVRASVCDGVCHIGRLAVHPQWQGHGIGTALMAHIEASIAGVARFELFTGAASEANLRLYRRLGYTPVRTDTISDRIAVVYLSKPT